MNDDTKGEAARPRAQQGIFLPPRMMRNRPDELQDKGEQDEPLLHLTLDGLLPDDQTLVLNPETRTATLFLNDESGKARIVTQQQFSPNGMRVLIPLLQAYPYYCPYEVLLASLFPLSLEECRKQLQEAWERSVRPIRRAIGSIMTGLHAFGFTVHSLRGVGYLLKPL